MKSLSGKIDKTGVLYISRCGRLVEQICPVSGMSCSHHCPMFGEPFWDEARQVIGIGLCGKMIITFDRFRDERENPNNKIEKVSS